MSWVSAAGDAVGVNVMVAIVSATGVLAAAIASALTAVITKRMDKPKLQAEADEIYQKMSTQAADLIEKEILRLERRIQSLEKDRASQAGLFRDHQPWDLRVGKALRQIVNLMTNHAGREGDPELMRALYALDLENIGDPPPLFSPWET